MQGIGDMEVSKISVLYMVLNKVCKHKEKTCNDVIWLYKCYSMDYILYSPVSNNGGGAPKRQRDIAG